MELHEYQKRIANFIAQHNNCILSVDMGLGKTASVLAWLNWAKPETCLIVAPKRVAETVWKQEAEKWGWNEIAEKMVICKGVKSQRAKRLADAEHPYKIIGRDNLKDLEGASYGALIIDELTSFKTIDSNRTKIMLSIQAPIKVGLTGTFLANGAIDIFAQAAVVGLSWGGMSFYAWRGSYFRDTLAGSGLAFHRWRLLTTLEELLKPIQQNIFTLTAEDYLQIPPVTETTHKVDVGEETRAAIDGLDAFLSMELGGEVLTFDEKQKFAKLQTLCNGFVYNGDDDRKPIRGKRSAKLEAVADFVADCKDAGEPVLLFYAFVEEAIWIAELLKARGVKFESVQKAGFLDRWNAGETECLFAHPASAGHGLNLQHGGRVIVWSTLTYNYELFAQGNARLARQGQKRNVQIHYFVADKTCEERAVKALQTKDKEQKQFLKMTKR